ncbi:MAG: hypothetical protein IJ761_06745 [Bacteroidales bacterium]|nr:hypothetical protein [Bacteroidales bacterium]
MTVLFCLFTFIACTNDNAHRWAIQAEPFAGNGTKMTINQRTASWVSGDAVKINSITAPIVVDGAMSYLDGDIPEANVYRAIFPASIAQSGTLDVDTVTVTLPSTYTYHESGGLQQLDLPMVAVGREFPLTFKHLTAGVMIGITNLIDYRPSTATTTNAYYIDKIVVSSDAYSLSGTRVFDITNVDGIESRQSNDADTIVEMDFANDEVLVLQNATKNILVPVLPVGTSNHFSITVNGHINLVQTNGTTTRRSYAVKMTQQVGGSLGRNKLAYAPMELNDTTRPDASMAFRQVDDTVYILTSDGMKMVFDSLRRVSTWKSKNIVLNTDVELPGHTMRPIAGFSGTFDGRGYSISGITLYDTLITTRKFGLFTDPSNAITLKNLTLNAVIRYNVDKSKTHYYGGFVGYTTKPVNIDNCTVKFAAYNYNVIAAASDVATIDFGGMVGYTSANVSITNCVVSFSDATLKIVGYSTTKTNIYATGLIGYATAAANITLQNNEVKEGTVSFSKYNNGYFSQYLRHASGGSSTISGNTFSAVFKDKNGASISLTNQNN